MPWPTHSQTHSATGQASVTEQPRLKQWMHQRWLEFIRERKRKREPKNRLPVSELSLVNRAQVNDLKMIGGAFLDVSRWRVGVRVERRCLMGL